MPSTVEVDVDGEAERGTILPNAKEGSNEGIGVNQDMTPMDAAPDVVQQSKKSEKSSSKKQVMGEGAEKTSSLNTDAVPAKLVADTDGTSTSPKLSLIIKEEMMKKKGLPVKKAIDTTAPGKNNSHL